MLAAFAMLGVAGVLVLVHRTPGRPAARLVTPMAAAWVGTASMFGWASYLALVALVRPGGPWPGPGTAGFLVLLGGSGAGLLLGVIGVLLLGTGPRPRQRNRT